jgi:hypothetical protein
VHEGPPANRVWDVYKEALAAIASDDRARLAPMHAEQFTCVWHEELAIRNTLGRDGWIDFALSTNEFSESTWYDDSLIAVRGDNLCVVRHLRNHDDYEYVRYGLIELEHEQFVASHWFGEAQLDEALAALDERHRQLSALTGR